MFSQVVLQEASLSASSDYFNIGMRRDVVQWFCSWLRRLITQIYGSNWSKFFGTVPITGLSKGHWQITNKICRLIRTLGIHNSPKNIFKILRPCGIFPIPFLPGPRLCLDCSFVRFQPWEFWGNCGCVCSPSKIQKIKNGVKVEILQKRKLKGWKINKNMT